VPFTGSQVRGGGARGPEPGENVDEKGQGSKGGGDTEGDSLKRPRCLEEEEEDTCVDLHTPSTGIEVVASTPLPPFTPSPTLLPPGITPRHRSGGRKIFKKTRHLLPAPSEQGSPGPGGGRTPEVPAHLVEFTTPEAFRFHLLEGCGTAIFESLVAGGEGAPALSCFFGFGAPTLGSEFSLSPWVTTPPGAERETDSAPAPADSEILRSL